MQLDADGSLNEGSFNELLRRAWKLAVITAEEDTVLNRIARSTAFRTPDERWRAAGIQFNVQEQSTLEENIATPTHG